MSAGDSPTRSLAAGPVAALAWALYLAAAWTWVIGMFLPVLLVRDFGDPGWWVFAVPNVIGAAAVGFVWRNAAASDLAVARHRHAMLAFSGATLLLHGLVIGAWLTPLFGWPWAVGAILVASLVELAAERRRAAVACGVVVTLVSLAAFAYWQKDARLWGLDPPVGDRLTHRDLLLAAPAIGLGFLLCPHLDLTLQRARRHTTPRTGRLAFALGFGVFFLAMIAFSLMYAPLLRSLFSPRRVFHLVPPLLIPLAIHVTGQAGLTAGLHLREMKRHAGHRGRLIAWLMVGLGLAMGITVLPGDAAGVESSGIGVDEAAYRVVLLLYGLAFPVYVLLMMSPLRRRGSVRYRGIVSATAIVTASPMAALGFLTESTIWLLGVYGVVLAAAAAVWWSPPPSASGDRTVPDASPFGGGGGDHLTEGAGHGL